MPVEGQWRRANTPLGRRDKRLLIVLACAAALAVAIATGVYLTRAAPRSDGDCVVVTVPSTMGGARVRACGAAAHAFCRTQGRHDARIAAACRRQGHAADLADG